MDGAVTSTGSTEGGYVSLPQLVRKYEFVLDIEGIGYSGRLKYLLFSNRCLFYVERTWVEFFNYQLIAYVHYIPVKTDLSNLKSQFEWAMANPKITKQIALNALTFAKKHLQRDAILKRVADTVMYIQSQPGYHDNND